MVTLLLHYDLIVLCHIISLSLYQIVSYRIPSYHNIILSLCALLLSVTMTSIHTTNTGWLPAHDTTTGYDSRCKCNKAIWGKKD